MRLLVDKAPQSPSQPGPVAKTIRIQQAVQLDAFAQESKGTWQAVSYDRKLLPRQHKLYTALTPQRCMEAATVFRTCAMVSKLSQ